MAAALAALLVTSVITFAATDATGIDPARAALGRLASPAQVKLYREQQGLDKPLVARYWIWLRNAASGNWGYSLTAQQSTASIVPARAVRSLLLAAIAMAVAVPLAILLGAIAARRAGGLVDNVLSTGVLLIVGVPEFVIGLVLLYLLAVWLHLVPPSSGNASYGSLGQEAQAYVLPALTLAVVLTPYMARMVRGSVREVLATPYIRSATLRGVSDRRMLSRHVLPNAVGPVINVIALSLAEVLAGEVIVENVFGFPGLGQLTVFAVSTNDVAVVQVCVLIAAAGFIFMSLVADGLIVLTNPRLRRAQRAA